MNESPKFTHGLANLTAIETKLFFRSKETVAWAVAFPLLLPIALGLFPGMTAIRPEFGGQRVLDLMFPPIVGLIIGMLTLNVLPAVLAGYRSNGILRRLSAAPIRPVAVLVAQVALSALLALGVTVVTLTIGVLAFDVAVPGHLLGFAVALVLCLASMIAAGLLIAALARNTQVALTVGFLVFSLLLIFAGFWSPGPMMPEYLRRISELSPLGAGAQAMTTAWAGDFPQLPHLAVLLGYAAVLGYLAARFFRWK